ncbi:MAG: rhomboid family intramembrane serine protease [Desulfobacteraceae bacterium]|jgi:membrane associated rhomboid family serine protease|nr:MAG: rhomboid family intramembrane serine protease [Desulfobacteraceae bacterium]
MIPLRDTTPSRNYPVVNVAIIAVNVLVYLLQMAQGPHLERFIFMYGLVPAKLSIPELADRLSLGQQAFPFFSFMFLHGGFWHLLGNMWSLYIFGDNVEDRMGPLRYLAFYILCGLVSGISHLVLNWQSPIPTIGASGAIAGVMGAYFLLFPSSKVLTFIPIFFIPYFIEVPAFVFLGIWFLLQFLNAAGGPAGGGGIAWWAHIGGFAGGMILLKLFSRMPESGLTKRVRPRTERHKSHRLQSIHTTGLRDDADIYGSIVITPEEAATGTQKIVNVPWGFHNRLVKVIVPPGIKEGMSLRLQGLGKQLGERKGDLLLKVLVQGHG